MLQNNIILKIKIKLFMNMLQQISTSSLGDEGAGAGVQASPYPQMYHGAAGEPWTCWLVPTSRISASSLSQHFFFSCSVKETRRMASKKKYMLHFECVTTSERSGLNGSKWPVNDSLLGMTCPIHWYVNIYTRICLSSSRISSSFLQFYFFKFMFCVVNAGA